MKRFFYSIFAIMMIACLTEHDVFSQQKKFRFAKLSRDVKKISRQYESKNYMVFPGRPPIGQQLNDAYTKQAETDDQGFPKYLIANGSSIANSQAAAQMQANELAKQNLVSLLETNMRSVIENEIGNNQLSSKDAASITKTMQVSVNKVAKKLSRVMELFSIYKILPNKNVEVQVLLGYSYELAQKAMIDEMKLQMEAEAEDMKIKYESFLNPEIYKQGEIKNIVDGQ